MPLENYQLIFQYLLVFLSKLVQVGETYSVRDQVHRLLHVLDAGRPYDFVADLQSLSCRAEAIAAFLALLELSRLHLVRIHQIRGDEGPGDILLYRTTREAQSDELEALSP
jgi:chromatin segregation and condensation protein Rec8/ScpA/Scc1 (kleisin family)